MQQIPVSRRMAAILALSTLAWLPLAAQAAEPGPRPPANAEQRDDRDREADEAQRPLRVQQHLERMANRLEIKASQQGVWRDYVEAHKAAFAEPPARPPQDADAATLARHHAERAADMARKLDRLATATAALQKALSPEQQQTLNQMARHAPPMGPGGFHAGHERRGMDDRHRPDGPPPDGDNEAPPRPRPPAPAKK